MYINIRDRWGIGWVFFKSTPPRGSEWFQEEETGLHTFSIHEWGLVWQETAWSKDWNTKCVSAGLLKGTACALRTAKADEFCLQKTPATASEYLWR